MAAADGDASTTESAARIDARLIVVGVVLVAVSAMYLLALALTGPR